MISLPALKNIEVLEPFNDSRCMGNAGMDVLGPMIRCFGGFMLVGLVGFGCWEIESEFLRKGVVLGIWSGAR